RGAEQAREEGYGSPPEAEQCVEALHPGGIGLNVRDLGESLEVDLKPVGQNRVARRQRDDESVREWILRQARDDFAHAAPSPEIRERSVARYEAQAAPPSRGLQSAFDRRGLGLARVPGEKDRELRVDRGLAGHDLQVRQHAVYPERQRKRDADGE